MLYNLFVFHDGLYINLFRYITFRSGCAALTALIIALVSGPYIIRKLQGLNPDGQPIRKDGPESHIKNKKGTPTMGGLIIHLSVFVSTVLWANLSNPFIWIVLFVMGSFAVLGFVDDYLKVVHKNSKGISAKAKIMIQAVVSIVACFFVQKYSVPGFESHVTIPFFKDIIIDLGYFYPVFVLLVIIGSSNAVNLTDGLDGLAIGPMAIACVCFVLICYLVGNAVFSQYLNIQYVPGAGEISVFCSALVGASLGFLWYNAHPAKVFMGDTGSLALGGALGIISVITKHEFILAIIGGVFVIEAVSVIIQVYYFKISGGKRVFLMAPIHHHFEKKGWSESQVVMRFWIIAIVFALLGMATLKIR
ncbi:MAG: phospho-N-acetylmuramoyl-pentapeptide-transferase [Rickettsiales bacterium]|nr:phospho-N-acetylmuramoyl-pentapeptide-transferase [Rickettsiales bacterium]